MIRRLSYPDFSHYIESTLNKKPMKVVLFFEMLCLLCVNELTSLSAFPAPYFHICARIILRILSAKTSHNRQIIGESNNSIFLFNGQKREVVRTPAIYPTLAQQTQYD